MEEAEKALQEYEQSTYAEIQPYFPDPIGDEPLELLSAQLEERRKLWLEQQEAHGTLVQRVENTRQELAWLHDEVAKHEDKVATDRIRAGKDRVKLAKAQAERRELFGDADADEVEQRLVGDLEVAENQYETVRNQVAVATTLARILLSGSSVNNWRTSSNTPV